jgi:hypothetical protein
MVRDAKTSEDFERLADYFDYQALDYKRKALEALKELEGLAASRFHPRTYSTHYASTLEQMQRYRASANECSDRANGYRALKAESGGSE